MANSIPTYQGYIFDLDGTLIDSSKDIAGALNRARVNLGLEALPEEQVLPMIGNGLPKLVERGFADSDLHYGPELIDKVRDTYLDDPCSNTLIYPGVIETLKALSHLPLAIISNKPSELMGPTLKKLQLEEYFSIVIGGEDFPQKKPHPAAAEFVIKKWQLPPREVLMVGDMSPDRELAINANMPFAFCRYGFLAKDLDADHLLDSLQDLIS